METSTPPWFPPRPHTIKQVRFVLPFLDRFDGRSNEAFGLFFALLGIDNSKATGLAAVVGGFLEGFFSPLSFVLDSRSLVFCFVLRGKSAQQRAAENPSILDPRYRYFDTGTAISSLFTFLWLHVGRG